MSPEGWPKGEVGVEGCPKAPPPTAPALPKPPKGFAAPARRHRQTFPQLRMTFWSSCMLALECRLSVGKTYT